MNLKCDLHHRRILATETSFLHKTGDNSPCDSKTASIGSQTFSVGHVASLPMTNQVKNHPHFEMLDIPKVGTKEFDAMIIKNGHMNFKNHPQIEETHCRENCVLAFGHRSECIVDSEEERLIRAIFEDGAELAQRADFERQVIEDSRQGLYG